MILKPEICTSIEATSEGMLLIIQEEGRVCLSASQVAKLSKWLIEGNGLRLEAAWDEGISRDDD